MISVIVFVTELEGGAIDVDELDFVGGTETHVGAFPRVDVTDDRLDERAQVAGGAMMDVEDNGGIAIVFYCLPFAEIVRGCHRKVEKVSRCPGAGRWRLARNFLPRATDQRPLVIKLVRFRNGDAGSVIDA